MTLEERWDSTNQWSIHMKNSYDFVKEKISDYIINLSNNGNLVNSLDQLLTFDVFSDYSLLVDPAQRKNSIFLSNTVFWYKIELNFKKPYVNSLWKVNKWHLQIMLYDSWKVWYLNAWLHPQSWKIKFSGMRKLDWNYYGIWDLLIKTYIEIAKLFSSEWKPIDYSDTTDQLKIDVSYCLQKNWYQANKQTKNNMFSIYKDYSWRQYIYTESSNKLKWDNRDNYIFLNSNPALDQNYKHIWDVFIGVGIKYRLTL